MSEFDLETTTTDSQIEIPQNQSSSIPHNPLKKPKTKSRIHLWWAYAPSQRHNIKTSRKPRAFNVYLKNLTNSLIKIPSIESSESEILKVHSSSYLNQIKNLQFDTNGNPRDKNTSSHTLKEKDSYDNYATFESAKIACGSLINSINYILDKKIDYAFNIITFY